MPKMDKAERRSAQARKARMTNRTSRAFLLLLDRLAAQRDRTRIGRKHKDQS